MAQKVRLNRRSVGNLRALHEPGRKERHWDEVLPGFFLRITPAGTATYCVWIDKKDFQVGSPDVLTPEDAREVAREHLVRAAQGGPDPKTLRLQCAEEEARKQADTFAALAEAYLAAPEKASLSARTIEQRRSNLDLHILPSLGARPVSTLRRADVKALIRDIQRVAGKGEPEDENGCLPGARVANICHGIVRTIFNWAMEEDRVEYNPAAFRKLFNDDPVKPALMPDEAVRVVWRALQAEIDARDQLGVGTALAIQLCFATLQRPNEVVTARKSDLDFKNRVWRIPAGRAKTNMAYEVPLSPLAVDLFRQALQLHDSEWVFPRRDNRGPVNRHELSQRWGRMRDRLVKAAAEAGGQSPLAGVRLYDARRLGRTSMVMRLGIPAETAELCIHHAPDRSMAVRYDVGDRSGLVRAAMEQWAELLLRVVEDRAMSCGRGLQIA
jgi:integrase